MDSGQRFTLEIAPDVRPKLSDVRNAPALIKDHYRVLCSRGVWDQGGAPFDAAIDAQINQIERKSQCFYFRHRPGMVLPVATELQQRADEYRQLKVSHSYTRAALWIAAAVAAADLIVRLWK